MRNKYLQFEILVGGKPLPEIDFRGETFIEAIDGRQFELRFNNWTPHRILVVPTVDGLSVMDGKVGSYDGDGYVLRGYQDARIPGFRLTKDEVAAFTFGAQEGSYAAKMDRPSNVGVIGVAAFREVERSPWGLQDIQISTHSFGRDILRRKTVDYGADVPTKGITIGPHIPSNTTGSPPPGTMYCCSMSDAAPTSGEMGFTEEPAVHAGTEFGKKTEHKVTSVSFERQSEPLCVLELFYDFRAGLLEKGVPVGAEVPVERPSSFPENDEGCTPPPGWES